MPLKILKAVLYFQYLYEPADAACLSKNVLGTKRKDIMTRLLQQFHFPSVSMDRVPIPMKLACSKTLQHTHCLQQKPGEKSLQETRF